MDFPAHRRYSNGKSYFRIINPSAMEEVQIIGCYFTIHRLEAKILPERNLITDLLEAQSEHIEVITADDFEGFLKSCREERKEKQF